MNLSEPDRMTHHASLMKILDLCHKPSPPGNLELVSVLFGMEARTETIIVKYLVDKKLLIYYMLGL